MKVEFNLPERTVDPTQKLGLTWFTISFHSCLKLWSKALTLFNIVKGKKLLIPSLLCLFCIATSLHLWWSIDECYPVLSSCSRSVPAREQTYATFSSSLQYLYLFLPFLYHSFSMISKFHPVTGHSHLQLLQSSDNQLNKCWIGIDSDWPL